MRKIFTMTEGAKYIRSRNQKGTKYESLLVHNGHQTAFSQHVHSIFRRHNILLHLCSTHINPRVLDLIQ